MGVYRRGLRLRGGSSVGEVTQPALAVGKFQLQVLGEPPAHTRVSLQFRERIEERVVAPSVVQLAVCVGSNFI
jgi:hypothetical protein